MSIKIKNYLVTSALLSALILLPLFPVRGDIDQSLVYLKTKTQNPWVTMALFAAGDNSDVDYLKSFIGTNASDYEAAILALRPQIFPERKFNPKT